MAPEKFGSLRLKSKPAIKEESHSSQTSIEEGLIALRYEEQIPRKPPIPVVVAPPRSPPTDIHPALRKNFPHGTGDYDDSKRDSGLAPTTSTAAREGSINTVDEHAFAIEINFNSTPSINTSFQTTPGSPVQSPVQSPITPKISKSDSVGSGISSLSRWMRKDSRPKTPSPENSGSTIEEGFSPITLTIPTHSLLGEEFLDNLSFSKRGSMMLLGKKAVNGHIRPDGTRRQPSFSLLTSPTIKVLSADLEKESQKVRSMYETTESSIDWRDGKEDTFDERLEPRELERSLSANGHLSPNMHAGAQKRPESAMSFRRESELAGGVEDWEDVNGMDVDRYGFIQMRRTSSRPGTPEPRPPQRVSTVLQLASESPRRKRVFGRSPSSAPPPSRKISARSLQTQGSHVSQRSTNREHFRAAANRLPGNKDRRWMEEAGDMLTLPPGLADIAEDAEGGKAVASLKKKEWERAEKWRKMAKVVKTGNDGEGMEFEFDAKSPKLIERTWKGIPDRWRAAAWHSFLSTSAKKREGSATDEQIVEAFHRLLGQSSADDVQIDVDVPRTINSHIMFRRRYRGGQRLLFRVLHALSLYFPETGYVQGMASLGATLLCYYDEEKTFIMLVRMWTLRGLDKLYAAGFGGLMSALDEFQKKWLDGSDVAKKLEELNVEPTSYGTRWYLTLFNYSIPFAAQLRVWDVFMLLGDSDPSLPQDKDRPFSGGLDIIHATGAALIDGTREILLDSDFENAMKVLTSWIPVKDEELLMKVTKAEWKLHHERGKKKKKA